MRYHYEKPDLYMSMYGRLMTIKDKENNDE